MKKKLANNLSLKVISVLIACVIWILVSGTVDPVRTNVRYSGVKVEVKNDGYILDAGKSYQIADEYQTVTVYVTGKKSVVEGRTDIAVEADLTQIVNMDTICTGYAEVCQRNFGRRCDHHSEDDPGND